MSRRSMNWRRALPPVRTSGWDSIRREPGLRPYLAGQGLGQIGDAATTLILAQIVLFDIDHGASAGTVGRAIATAVAPAMAVTPIASLLADRWNRRRSLAVMSAARALVALAAICVPVTGNRILGYGCVGVLLVLSRSMYLTRAAAVAHFVPHDRLVSLDSVALLVGLAAGGTGALLGGSLSSTAPIAGLCCAAVLHLAGSLCFVNVPADLGGGNRSTSGHVEAGAPRRDRLAIARTIVGSPGLRRAVAATAVARALLGAVIAIVVITADQRYEMHANGFAMAMGLVGVGTFAGTLMAPAVAARVRTTFVIAGAALASAIGLSVASMIPRTVVLVGATMIVALGFQVVRLVSDAAVQRAAPDESLGKVFSVHDAVHTGAFALGALAASAGAAGPSSPARLFPVAVLQLGVAAVAIVSRRRPQPLRVVAEILFPNVEPGTRSSAAGSIAQSDERIAC